MNQVLEVIRSIWKTKELRNKILFILSMLFIFRLAAHIPLPGVDLASLKKIFESNQLFGLLNVFSGGSLDKFSIVMLGVAPYITASIILQLLQMIVPALEALKKEGEAGQRKINMYTRWLTVPLAVIQGYGFITLFRKSSDQLLPNLGILDFAVLILMVTAGTMFLVWMGELITEKKLGNGTSLIIFAGILSGLPTTVAQTASLGVDSNNFFNIILFIIVGLITIVGVVFITEGQRQVPISFARRIRGTRQFGGADTYLPLRVNLGGVIPIIFAVSIVVVPGLIAQFFKSSSNYWLAHVSAFIIRIFDTGSPFYLVLYFTLVFAFTYFYTAVIFHPLQIAENLQKQGGFIPGIRPGAQTAEYLNYTINRIILAGAAFLGIIAILPYLTQKLFGDGLGSIAIGGTSLLIAVSVALEVKEQIKAQLAMRSYDSY